MRYRCITEHRRYFAIIETDDGERISEKECASKFEAMTARDTARNWNAKAFAEIPTDGSAPPVSSAPVVEVASEPAPQSQAPQPAAATEAEPAPEAKPKRQRKPRKKGDA